MSEASLKFGTSGLRGLASELQGQAARRYVGAFLSYLEAKGFERGGMVYLGRDFRPSSPSILRDCAVAIEAAGYAVTDCGTLPTPALALHAMAGKGAAIMVTGSHIPADRNGLKFYLPTGEISKQDELGIVDRLAGAAPDDREPQMIDAYEASMRRYFDRFAELLPAGALQGWRVGVFEHSTVARDFLGKVLRHFGCDVIGLGRIDGFIPVDTEAFGDAVFAPLPGWLAEHRLDAIVSADGDGDRPLLMDGSGQFVRGDVLGLLAARFLGARTVVTPVTSNSGIERTGAFERVVRTRVGSPYVMAAMEDAPQPVVGFEANGGTFVGRGVAVAGAPLAELATRDAVLPLLSALGLAAREGKRLDEIVASLPLGVALADRLQDVSPERSARFLSRLQHDEAYAAALFAERGIASLSTIDGLQFRTAGDEIVHFRASGNAPELRCYVEGMTVQSARDLLAWGMAVAAREVA